MKKLAKILVFLGLFLSCAFGAINENKLKMVTIGTQSMFSAQNLAVVKGYFHEEFAKLGIRVKVVNFDTGKGIINAITNHSVDFGFVGTPPFVISTQRGLDIKIIYADHLPKTSEALVVKSDGKYNSVKDLKGAKIGVVFASSSHYALHEILKLHGVNEKDVTLVDLNPSDMFVAWNKGTIDAAIIWDNTLSTLGNAKTLFTVGDLYDKNIVIANVNITSNKLLQRHPEAVKAYINALERAVDDFNNNIEENATILANYFSISTEKAEEMIKKDKWANAKDQKEFIEVLHKNLYTIATYWKDFGFLEFINEEKSFKDLIKIIK